MLSLRTHNAELKIKKCDVMSHVYFSSCCRYRQSFEYFNTARRSRKHCLCVPSTVGAVSCLQTWNTVKWGTEHSPLSTLLLSPCWATTNRDLRVLSGPAAVRVQPWCFQSVHKCPEWGKHPNQLIRRSSCSHSFFVFGKSRVWISARRVKFWLMFLLNFCGHSGGVQGQYLKLHRHRFLSHPFPVVISTYSIVWSYTV